MAKRRHSPLITQPVEAGLRDIDALFESGGLTHSPRSKRSSDRGVDASSKEKATGLAKKRRPAAAKSAGAQELEILRVAEWAGYPWLVHGFSTRKGGVSTTYRPGERCGELNLGFTGADSRDHVERNRELFVKALLEGPGQAKARAGRKRAEDVPLRLLRQIHSGVVHRVEGATDSTLAGDAQPLRGDGMIATEPGTLLGIQTADCIPVLIVDVRRRIVAAFHAGWRGTLARIVERGVGRLRAEFGSQPGDLTAAIGPGIGPCCYSVGEEVRMEFDSQFGYADELFQEVFDLDPIKEKYPMLFLTARAPGHSNLGPSLHLDLPQANRRQLLDAGLAAEKIHSLNVCTACDTKRFFSHRAEQGFTGRMLSAIGMRRQ